MKTGYKVIRKAISATTAELLCLQFEIQRNAIYYVNEMDGADESKLFAFGDRLTAKSFSNYGFVGFEGLMLQMLPVVEKATGKRLLPTYSYGRVYYKGAVLGKHIDRPSCEYSVTLTLSVDGEPWDIWMTNFNGVAKPLSLNVGDMCVYQGQFVEHWRDEYQGNKQIQVFLHYVDADGQNKSFAYDNRPMLGLIKETK